VRKLGVRFLWVVALCLLQNGTDDLQRGIKVMDPICENYFLTIIAASGHDANAGLPGIPIGNRRPYSTNVAVNPGQVLGVHVALDRQVRSSLHYTYQSVDVSYL
jgi:hypothetical protein